MAAARAALTALRAVARRPLAITALLAAVAGCASAGRLADGYRDVHRLGPETGGDGWLRTALERGTFDSALVRLTTGADVPADALLRSLYTGLVAHYGGQLETSARAFAEADAVADDRFTKSLTRTGLSLLSSDLALPYAAGRTERLLVHYYGVLGFLRHDSTAAAAVEARRLSKLLEQYGEDRALDERSTHAVLHYLAGVAFDAAGERTDAAVAYRNAAALAGDSLLAAAVERPTPARASRRPSRTAARATAPPPAHAAMGEVVLVLEQGFIGHRIEESATVGFDSTEVVRFASGQADTSLAALLAQRLAQRLAQPRGTAEGGRMGATPPLVTGEPRASRRHRGALRAIARAAAEASAASDDEPGPRVPSLPADAAPSIPAVPALPGRAQGAPGYLLRVAWPAFFRPPTAPGPLAVLAVAMPAAAAPQAAPQAAAAPTSRAGSPGAPAASGVPRYQANLTDAAARDFERQRAALVSRAVVRAAAKYWATRTAERKGGRFGGAVASAAASFLERADTRSWSLLPGSISVARLTLPVGTQRLVVELPGSVGAPRRVAVGEVVVRADRVAVVSTRLWNEHAGVVPAPPVPSAPRTAAY